MKAPRFIIIQCLLVMNSAALDLVRDGKPVATIVREVALAEESPAVKGRVVRKKAGAESDEALAVRTLVEWVKKITDVELPVADHAADGVPAIHVGKAAVAAGLKLDDIVSASREGMRIVADENRSSLGWLTARALAPRRA